MVKEPGPVAFHDGVVYLEQIKGMSEEISKRIQVANLKVDCL
ncbi:MAG: hypothetical protein OZSIB_0953 [Candidatus Ozemobacter sibiricus]|uniref:Uncharacterized protein n=1 Tax=Candidatus Ozemobacter sibiricus TaxID=2268124 RepID=A0A367ZL35_9BACT|nr:MAG: hypothetical protein OZSIB_0953 [Candidatus Ozemobacter sibiricus]